MRLRGAVSMPEGVPVKDETKKNVVAAPYPCDPASTPSRCGIRTGRASCLADAAAFLRGFLARQFEVAPVVPSSVSLEAAWCRRWIWRRPVA